MASRISQMRNGIPQTMRQPSQQQMQMNQLVEQIRGMMQQVKMAQNPQVALEQMIQNNPNTAVLAKMLKNNGNLESIARQMAGACGIDMDQVINQLPGGL